MNYLAIDKDGLAVSGIWDDESVVEDGLTLQAITGGESVGWSYINGSWVKPADTRTYQEKRGREYPTIGEQLDMQYWDSVNGTTTWADRIGSVKSEIPKD